jgi:hypothetical protein
MPELSERGVHQIFGDHPGEALAQACREFVEELVVDVGRGGEAPGFGFFAVQDSGDDFAELLEDPSVGFHFPVDF